MLELEKTHLEFRLINVSGSIYNTNLLHDAAQRCFKEHLLDCVKNEGERIKSHQLQLIHFVFVVLAVRNPGIAFVCTSHLDSF